jgi:division protein CdvB (Snf7/Vps24/ESCRT-III family)
MPSKELKEREEVLQALLKKIDADIDVFTKRLEALHAKHEELNGVVLDAGLEPVPISFQAGKNADVIGELESHVLELNKLKNLLSMKLRRILQEEDLLEHLQTEYGRNVTFKRNARGGVELQVQDADAEDAYVQLQISKKKLDELREQIHELGDSAE